jgi:hypothetical protein
MARHDGDVDGGTGIEMGDAALEMLMEVGMKVKMMSFGMKMEIKEEMTWLQLLAKPNGYKLAHVFSRGSPIVTKNSYKHQV